MAGLGKKLGQLRQWTGEKMGSTSRTETSFEFMRLEQETQLRHAYTERVHEACTAYLRGLGKRKESTEDKAKKLPVEILAMSMLHFGQELHDESAYGKALMQFGEAHTHIASITVEYVTRVRDGYVQNLQNILAQMREYEHHKKKLESRRLDYDSKVNKILKSRREKPELEEELRQSQLKYEESLEETTRLMISLNTNEPDQLQDLLAFVDAEAAFYQNCFEVVRQLQASLASVCVANGANGSLRHNAFQPTAQGSLDSISAPSVMSSQRMRQSSVGSVGLSGGLNGGANGRDSVGGGCGRDSSTASIMQPPPVPSDDGADPPMSTTPTPAYVAALYPFDAEKDDELTIAPGDVVRVLYPIDEGWWEGESTRTGRTGMFPQAYCTPVAAPPAVAVSAATPVAVAAPPAMAGNDGTQPAFSAMFSSTDPLGFAESPLVPPESELAQSPPAAAASAPASASALGAMPVTRPPGLELPIALERTGHIRLSALSRLSYTPTNQPLDIRDDGPGPAPPRVEPSPAAVEVKRTSMLADKDARSRDHASPPPPPPPIATSPPLRSAVASPTEALRPTPPPLLRSPVSLRSGSPRSSFLRATPSLSSGSLSQMPLPPPAVPATATRLRRPSPPPPPAISSSSVLAAQAAHAAHAVPRPLGATGGFNASSPALLSRGPAAAMAAAAPSSSSSSTNGPPTRLAGGAASRSLGAVGLYGSTPAALTHAAAATAAACSTCGCDDFQQHAFKVGYCTQCYHKH